MRILKHNETETNIETNNKRKTKKSMKTKEKHTTEA
jgi:hypothetical protein